MTPKKPPSSGEESNSLFMVYSSQGKGLVALLTPHGVFFIAYPIIKELLFKGD
jgi:hypothetical protein